tara:strand:+ start:641 stop:2890 length:2250 start_codon:yes stop_codon:yes gene_type:complete
MNMKLDIYVEGQRLDLFKDEAMSLKLSLKDSMSPDKMFTGVSKSYTVPASKNNNKIFKHYYRTDIGNYVDARVLLDCELRLAGVMYRQGNLSLEKVSTKNNKAHSYSIRFYGNLTELTKRIGEESLGDLDLTAHDINNPNWYNLMRTVSNVAVPPILFPLCSNKSRLIFHSGDRDAANQYGENYRNIAYVDSTVSSQYGLNTDELVGAYSCKALLDAIEVRYGITITGALRAAYVHNYRILLTGSEGAKPALSPFTGYTPNVFSRSANGEVVLETKVDGIHGTINVRRSGRNFNTYLKYKVNSSSIAEYTIHLLRDGVKIHSMNQDTHDDLGTYSSYLFDNSDGDYLYTFELEHVGSGSVSMQYYTSSAQVTLSSEYVVDESNTDTLIVSANTGGGDVYKISENIPKMKIKDFLTTLFKQFNIVTIVEGLEVKTFHYDYFISDGETVDVTKYIDISSGTISPPNYYSGISFKNEDPETYMEETYFSVNQANYGSLDHFLLADDKKIVGSVYEIKVPTQRIPTERVKDLSNSEYAKTSTMSLTDINGDYVSTKPVFTYCAANYQGIALALNDGSGTVRSINRHSIVSNICYQYQALSKYTGLLGNFWGSENDEYHQDERFGALGHFNCFWSNYVRHSFDESTRSLSVKAHLPMQLILGMQLNTKLVIASQTYIIESMDTNFLTGVTSLKLSSISKQLLDNTQASTLVIERDDPSTNSVRVVYLSSVTGRIEVSNGLTVNAIGDVKEVTEW